MWAFPGLGVSIEMDLYVQAGFPPLEALRSATRRLGPLAGRRRSTAAPSSPASAADFLILDADPLADVKNLRKIREVFKEGNRVIPR